MQRIPFATFTFLLTSGVARASTYVVDSSGAGQFLDIQAAVDAAAPGDVLLVQHGVNGHYAGFALDKPLVIIGYGGVSGVGATLVHDTAAGERVALVDMGFQQLDVSNCIGPVLVQGANFQQQRFTVSASNDVRFAQVRVAGDPTHPALRVQSSRVEIVDSTLGGGSGLLDAQANGTAALEADGGSRIQIARSLVVGGWGSDSTAYTFQTGNGGPAFALTAPVEIYLVGPRITEPVLGDVGQFWGGGGGWGEFQGSFECWADGLASCAITGSGLVHDDDGVLVSGGYTNQQFHCVAGHYEPRFCGPSELSVTPPDPSLRVTGTPAPGAPITFTVYGEPGALATIFLGRGIHVTATPGVDIEQLAPHSRAINLGVTPANGVAARTVILPSMAPQGFVLVAQADITGTNGLRRTNSTPIVLR